MASSSSVPLLAGVLSNGQVSELQQSGDYSIKSETVTPKLGASLLFPKHDIWLCDEGQVADKQTPRSGRCC